MNWINRKLMSLGIAIAIIISLITFHDTRLVLGVTVLTIEASLAVFYALRKKYSSGGMFAIAMVATALSFSDKPLLRDSDIFIVAMGIVAIGVYNKYVVAPRTQAAKERRIEQSGITQIDGMDTDTFKERMELHFHEKGWYAERTPDDRKNYGIDLVVVKPEGTRVVVQLQHSDGTVGTKSVEQVVAGRPYYHADAGMLVTTGGFTTGAREVAKTNDIELCDRADLIDSLLGVVDRQKAVADTVEA